MAEYQNSPEGKFDAWCNSIEIHESSRMDKDTICITSYSTPLEVCALAINTSDTTQILNFSYNGDHDYIVKLSNCCLPYKEIQSFKFIVKKVDSDINTYIITKDDFASIFDEIIPTLTLLKFEDYEQDF